MSLFLSVILGLSLFLGLVSSAKFDELFQPYWASDHFTYEGELLHMKLDNYSGVYSAHSSFHLIDMSSIYVLILIGPVLNIFRSWILIQEQVHVWESDRTD